MAPNGLPASDPSLNTATTTSRQERGPRLSRSGGSDGGPRAGRAHPELPRRSLVRTVHFSPDAGHTARPRPLWRGDPGRTQVLGHT